MMFAALTLWATLAAAPAPRFDKTVEFIGFSRNESVSAWRIVNTIHHSDGAVDRFALICVVETASDSVLATFRDSDARRMGPTGRPTAVSEDVFAAANSDWHGAGARSAWLSLKRQAQFGYTKLELKDSLVRILTDDDTQVTVKHMPARLQVSTPTGSALGYHMYGRLMDGTLLPLGYYRVEAVPNEAWHATIEVYVSATGRAVAVLNRFSMPEAPIGSIYQAKIIDSPKQSLATFQVGTVRLMEIEAESAAGVFNTLHPRAAAEYHRYVD